MTNIAASTNITPLTIQCACANRCGMSRVAASVQEIPGIMTASITRTMRPGQMRLLSHVVSVASAILACLAVHGCANVDGGAVELSWKLRSASGATKDFLQCGDVPVSAIRLDWEVGAATSSQSWSCAL